MPEEFTTKCMKFGCGGVAATCICTAIAICGFGFTDSKIAFGVILFATGIVFVSGFLGWLFAESTSYFSRSYAKIPENHTTTHIPPEVVGLIERTAFSLIICFIPLAQAVNVLSAMMAWLALKLAANWNHSSRNDPFIRRSEGEKLRTRSIIALISGLVSMAFAYAGGWIARLPFEWWGNEIENFLKHHLR